MGYRRVCIVCCVLLIAVTGCAASIKPAMKQRTDQLLGGYSGSDRVVVAPQAPRLRPWHVGQWAIYRDLDDRGHYSYVKNSVVAEDDCGFWLEQEVQDYYGRNITKTCYSAMPAVLTETGHDVGGRAADLMQVIITQQDGAKPTVLDFRTEQGRMSRAMMGAMGLDAALSMRLLQDQPQQDVNAAAGKFQKTFVTLGVTTVGPVRFKSQIWFHPEVPVSGIVRSVSDDGKYMRELLDYGEEGAQSALLDLP